MQNMVFVWQAVVELLASQNEEKQRAGGQKANRDPIQNSQRQSEVLSKEFNNNGSIMASNHLQPTAVRI